MELKGFSIVLCTHNGKIRLEPTLIHIASLHIPQGIKAELIVIDNASTDGTGAFAEAVWSKLGAPFPLSVIYEDRPGKGYAVETGYDAARYSYIVTVDDDNWLDKAYLAIALEIIESNPKIGLGGGRGIAVFEDIQPKWFESLHTVYAVGKPIPHTGFYPKARYWVCGAGMFFKKEIWVNLRNAGFSFVTSKGKGKAVGEDTELSLIVSHLGYQHYFDDRLIYYHYMPAGRMAWKNCINMYDGFAKTSPFIKIYIYVANRMNVNKPPTTTSYLLFLIVNNFQGFLDRRKIIHLFNVKKVREGDRSYLGYRELIGFWKTVFTNFRSLDRALKKIALCYSNLNGYKIF
jgi:glycosyltransferase involved in cell wall biosynthesis